MNKQELLLQYYSIHYSTLWLFFVRQVKESLTHDIGWRSGAAVFPCLVRHNTLRKEVADVRHSKKPEEVKSVPGNRTRQTESSGPPTKKHTIEDVESGVHL